jgi:hypothetical protein
VPVVQVPPRGVWGKRGKPILASGETWLGARIGTDDSPDEMVLRYLAAFGPANGADVQTWCWRTRLGPVLERLRPQLVTFRDEAGRELFDVPDAPMPDPDTPAPVRFFPTYDNIYLSHKDRRRVLGDDVSWTTAPSQFLEIFRFGSFAVDGFVVGGWRFERDAAAGRAMIVPIPLLELSPAERRDVEAEAVALAAFLAPELADRDVRWEPRGGGA